MILAEHGEAAGFLGIPTLVWQVANLVTFLGLLWYFLRKPVAEFFGGRRQEVAKAIAKAEEDRRRAESLAGELAKRLAEIETELAHLREGARRDADTEHAALLKETEEEAARVVARASADVENRVRAARAELTAYAGDLAVDLAKDLLAKGVTPDDEARLAKAGIADLRAKG